MGIMSDLKKSIKYATKLPDADKSVSTHTKVAKWICPDCGFMGNSIKCKKGSIGISIIFWLVTIVLGLVYSIWRMSTKYDGCPHCRGRMILTSSPKGKSLVDQYHT